MRPREPKPSNLSKTPLCPSLSQSRETGAVETARGTTKGNAGMSHFTFEREMEAEFTGDKPSGKPCTRCGMPIRPGAEVWLEGNFRTGTYHKPGEVPPGDSQGAF